MEFELQRYSLPKPARKGKVDNSLTKLKLGMTSWFFNRDNQYNSDPHFQYEDVDISLRYRSSTFANAQAEDADSIDDDGCALDGEDGER